jgi:predicted TIM-barrel fold metal-dependent hydrolase
MPPPYPIIALEEHFWASSATDFYASKQKQDPYSTTVLLRRCRDELVDLGAGRLASMEKTGVAMQVLSHAASFLALDVQTCVKVNDELAQAAAAEPTKFAGFATLPMQDPAAACDELRRCVTELKFVGALIDNTCEGKFYDDRFFWPVFEAAEELSVPVYLHPSYNEQTKPLLYDGNYPDAIAQTLSMHAWGWHVENGGHILRLFAAGFFDCFPKLKLILGHMGEMLPYQLDRIVRITEHQWPIAGVKPERGLKQCWDENIWVTTSGMFAVAPMATLLRQCKPDRILMSIDYPFARVSWLLLRPRD